MERELISKKDHQAFAEIVREHAGIQLGESKRQLLTSRLLKRMRALKIPTFTDYRTYLEDNMEAEFDAFINSITTNLTSFFREDHHFRFLRKYFDEHADVSSLNIWSAGCSTGEEPYSIAMVVAESGTRVPVSIRATDIDTDCLKTASQAVYRSNSVEGMDVKRRRAFFKQGAGAREGFVRVKQGIREQINFSPLNLLEPLQFPEPIDIIFCRNVVIYFDKPTQRSLFDRFANLMTPDGVLIIGHSESLHRVTERFKPLGQTIYQRIH